MTFLNLYKLSPSNTLLTVIFSRNYFKNWREMINLISLSCCYSIGTSLKIYYKKITNGNKPARSFWIQNQRFHMTCAHSHPSTTTPKRIQKYFLILYYYFIRLERYIDTNFGDFENQSFVIFIVNFLIK